MRRCAAICADELLARANALGRIQLRDDYLTGLDWNLLHLTTVRGFAGTLFADVGRDHDLRRLRVLARSRLRDVGYSFRVLHDAFGVYQQLLSIDFAVPLNRHDPYATCLGHPVRRAPIAPRSPSSSASSRAFDGTGRRFPQLAHGRGRGASAALGLRP